MGSVPGYLTHTHGGVPDKKLEEDLGKALAKARREGENQKKETIK